jgi:glycosyltransferase involved in cell wall biosynthesis
VRVLLDAGPAVHQSAGLSRYAERLAAHLLRFVPGDLDLTLFYNAHSGHTLPPSLHRLPSVTLPLGQVAWRLGALASQVAGLPFPPVQRALDRAGAPALYHATEHLLPRVQAPTVLTVHDLIFERYPEHHTHRNVAFLRAAMPRFVRAADAVIAVSEHTKRDLVDIYGTPPAKIAVVYEGIDPAFRPAPPEKTARVRAAYSPDAPYLLMVGTLEPRKNHATALRALAHLTREGCPHHLVIAGGRGWLFEPVRDLVARLGLAGRVRFAGYVPDADLPALYAGAACVLLPSLYEGFGFPVLEAMACGAPVVCSNASSLPEVAGSAALLVSPEDDAALADAVRLVLTQPALAAAMRARGLTQAARFRWERCAAETLAVYRSVAGI